MPRSIPRTSKRHRPKTSVKGKRYLCAKCRKRSPRPVKTPAPWYCPRCLAVLAECDAGAEMTPELLMWQPRSIHGLDPPAELDVDELGYFVAEVMGVSRLLN